MSSAITELQDKRAANLIWNAAGDYGFTPDFKSFDSAGQAEIYFNCILGAARKHYDYAQLQSVFAAFDQYEEGEMYQGLFWLGLENCVFCREVDGRPALAALRRQYAEAMVAEYSRQGFDDYRLFECLARAHYMRVLGQEPDLSGYDLRLLDELEFPPELSTEELVCRAKELFSHWFQIRTEERKREKRGPLFSLKRRGPGKGKARRFGGGFLLHSANAYGGAEAGGRDGKEEIRSKMSAAELRSFMTEKYGQALFSDWQTQELENLLCTGNHAGCHLHFTKGVPVKGTIRNGFEALQKTKEADQIARNRQTYQKNLSQNRTCIAKLAGKIQNSVLLYMQPSPVKSGRINGGTVWRAVHLDDDRVFVREENGDLGNLSVDILLDASTSQKNRQETVSGQGYIIAEALQRCGIPCRVSSFCSMTGYTILRIFRDYNEPGSNDKIFEYVSNGCNRDGLAIRAVRQLMSGSDYEHKILIILSDVKPNDIKKIPGGADGELVPYEKQAGIRDVASEVRLARAEGIAVICVFTGEDEDLPAAKLVYGRDFTRIQSMDKMADAVGTLIQNQIRNL